jgi:hypothetical protein
LVRGDLLDSLNEFFLQISYLVCTKNNHLRLLHCSSYRDNNENIILVGNKNSGKSRFVQEKAIDNYHIYADDLLIWTKNTTFVSLGLPLRIRRENIQNKQLIKKNFLVGKNILYSHINSFDLAKFGDEFELDKLLLMMPNYSPEKVSLLNTFKVIKKFIIDENLYTIKRKIK